MAAAGCGGSAVSQLPSGPGDPVRGESIAALAGGCGCHSAETGAPLSGGRALATPFGTFHSSNLTSDRETGLGAWTDDEIDAALRRGRLPDGSMESPVMPWYQYAGMADADARDLIAWMRTLEPVRRERSEDETFLPRLAFRAWALLFAPPLPEAPEVAPTEPLARGRYLVKHVSICGDCHTPRGIFGAPDSDLELAGHSGILPDDGVVPNITPDRATGIGDWDLDDLVSVLEMGMLPNLDSVSGLMAEVVDGVHGAPGYGRAPLEDLRAIAGYLRTVAPIPHAVREAKDNES